VDEGADDVGEVWQFLEVADGVPVRGVDPIVGVDRLCLPVDIQLCATLKKEAVFFLVDFLQAYRHHEA
jgi:hypothetical protein